MNASRLAVVTVAALALAACSARSESPRVTVTAQAPNATQATTAPSSPAGTVTQTVTAPGVIADPSADYASPRGGEGAYFFTPTRNIGCGLDASLVGCQVFTTTAVPPGADCDRGTMPRDKLSKGYLSQNGGSFAPSCFNQGVFFMINDQKTLQYGHSVTAGGMTCVSETKGVTCRRGPNGFFVSVESFRQW